MLLETIIYASEPKVWWEIWLSPIVTIVGLGVTWYLTTKTIKKEVEHKKVNIVLDKLVDVPSELLHLFDSMGKKTKDKDPKDFTEDFVKLMVKIFTYGKEDAIKIAASMQEYIYLNNGKKEFNPHRLMAYYIVLTCQIKYDLTGIEINPEYWYKIKLKDYEIMKPGLKDATNMIVKDLNLSNFLKVK